MRLFTDFRYIQAARAIGDVEAVETRRDLIGELAESLSGSIGFETTIRYAQFQALAAGGLELVPRSGLVEALRAVKDETELESLRRACAITDRVFEDRSGGEVAGAAPWYLCGMPSGGRAFRSVRRWLPASSASTIARSLTGCYTRPGVI